MDKLYVLGGRQRKPGLKETTYENEWCMYETALILEVDTNSGSSFSFRGFDWQHAVHMYHDRSTRLPGTRFHADWLYFPPLFQRLASRHSDGGWESIGGQHRS